jgi:hypothetical protein
MPILMWKSLNPGDSVTLGDTIRHISSHAVSAFGAKAYEVVRSELHYFEIAARPESSMDNEPERRIIKYIDIGYHLGLEVWLEQMSNGY